MVVDCGVFFFEIINNFGIVSRYGVGAVFAVNRLIRPRITQFVTVQRLVLCDGIILPALRQVHIARRGKLMIDRVSI